MVASRVEDVVSDNSQLQFALQERLASRKVEIDVSPFPTLCEVMSTHEMSVKLQGRVLCQTEVVDPSNCASRIVRTGAAFVFGSEVVKGQVAICRELPPLGGLRRNLQLQSFAPAIACIDDAVERYACIISSTDVVDNSRSAPCIDCGRHLCLAKHLAP